MLDQIRKEVDARFETGEFVAHLFQQVYLQRRKQMLSMIGKGIPPTEYDGIAMYAQYVRTKIRSRALRLHVKDYGEYTGPEKIYYPAELAEMRAAALAKIDQMTFD